MKHMIRLCLRPVGVWVVVVSVACLGGAAYAADGTWNTSTDASHWNLSANWFEALVADGSGSTASFKLADVTVDTTVRLDTARTIGGLTFGDAGTNSPAGWVLDNNGNAANVLTLSGGTPTIAVYALGTDKGVTLSGVGLLSGSSGMTKSGAGSLTLAGSADYTGQTTVNEGALTLGGGAHALRARQALVINGGTLDLGAANQYVGTLSGTGGNITGSSGTLTVEQPGNSRLVYSGTLEGSVNLTLARSSLVNSTSQFNLSLTEVSPTAGTVTLVGGDYWGAQPSGFDRPVFNGLALKDGGRLTGVSGITLNNGTLYLNNNASTTALNGGTPETSDQDLPDRVNDAAAITLNGGRIYFLGRAATDSSESFGAVTAASGMSSVTAVTGGTGTNSAVLTLASLARADGATLQVDGTNLGTSGNGNGRIFVTDALAGNLAPVGETGVGIVPGVFRGTPCGTPPIAVGYVPGQGFVPVGASGGPTAYSGNLNAAATNDNVRAPSAHVVADGGQTIHSLQQTGSITFVNATNRLTLASGMLLQTAGTKDIGTAGIPGQLTSGLGTGEFFLIKDSGAGAGGTLGDNQVYSVITDNGMTRVRLVLNNYSRRNLTNNDWNLMSANTHSGGTVMSGGNELYLTGPSEVAGVAPIPAAFDPAKGLIINNSRVTMRTLGQQIAASNIVTLNGGSILTLTGSSNTLAGIVFDSHGGEGNTRPTVSGGATLRITGDISSTPSSVVVTPTISVTLDLDGSDAHDISVAAMPEGNAYRNGATWTPLKGLAVSAAVQNGGFTKQGGGVLELSSGSSSYSGQLTVEEGALCVGTVNNASANGPLGNSAASVILGGSGKTGIIEYTGGNASSTKTFTIAAGGTGGFQIDNGGSTLTLNGLLDGDGALLKTGPGILVLSVANTHAGGTIVASGTLRANHADALNTSGDISFTGGILQYAAASASTDWAARIRNSTAAIALDSSGQTVTLAGALDGTNLGGLTKSGAGTLILSGANAYGGVTTINGGTLALGAADVIPDGAGKGDVNVAGTLDMNGFDEGIGGLSGTGSGVVNNSGAASCVLTVGDDDANGVFDGVIRNTGSHLALTKVGVGVLTLTGANSYGGATTVSEGTLVGYTGGGCANSVVSVEDGATHGVRVIAPNGTWTCAGLTYGAGSTVAAFDFGNLAPSTTVAPLEVGGDLAIDGTLGVVVRGSGVIPAGSYPLIHYTGSLSGTPPTVPLELPVGVAASIFNNIVGQSIDLAVTVGNTNTLSWRVGDGAWDTSLPNWKDSSGVATNFQGHETVLFDDTASGASPIAVTLDINVSPAAVIVSNTTKTYTIGGIGGIGGFAGLTKLGAGTLTNACVNSGFVGTLSVMEGTMSVGTMNNASVNGPLGSGSSAVLLGDTGVTGTLQYTGASAANARKFTMATNGVGMFQVDAAATDLTLSGVIGGGGTLGKAGNGSLYLTSTANTYTGGTVIAGGRLAPTSDTSLGAVPVAAQGTNIIIRNGGKLRTGVSSGMTFHANRGIVLGPGVQTFEKVSRNTVSINGIISGEGGANFGDTTAAGQDGGGGGRTHLYGANTYTGDTTITFVGTKDPGVFLHNSLSLQNSTLDYNTANAPSAGALIWFNSARSSYTLGGLKGNKNLDLSPQGNQSHTLRIGNNDQNTTFSGVISTTTAGNGIAKIGVGTLTLAGANTYNGSTSIESGILRMAASGSINNSPMIVLAPGGVLDVTDKLSYTMLPNQTFVFGIDGPPGNSSGRIVATGLDITGGKVDFVIAPEGPGRGFYVLAEFATLTGAEFASVTNVPADYEIVYEPNRIVLKRRGWMLFIK